MGLILHDSLPSPSARAVKLCLTELGLKAEIKSVNISEKENRTEEYLRKNPQHTVPTLEDGDFAIWDSHAINGYLVAAYGKDDSLYPKDPKVRALVDQRLHFDSGVLFPALRNIVFKVVRLGEKEIAESDREKANEAVDFIETFLQGRRFITGGTYNIADFSIYTSLSALLEVIQTDLEKYPNIKQYLASCKSSFKGINSDKEGLKSLVDIFREKLSAK